MKLFELTEVREGVDHPVLVSLDPQVAIYVRHAKLPIAPNPIIGETDLTERWGSRIYFLAGQPITVRETPKQIATLQAAYFSPVRFADRPVDEPIF